MPADDSAADTPSPRRRAAWYFAAVGLTCVLVFLGMRLDLVSLRAPLSYDGDALLIMPMVKSVLETGTHWRIERMGYPGVLTLHDFPVIDHLHFAIIWLLGLVLHDWCVVYNAYYLLTYPLTTLTGMYAFRKLGLSLPVAALGGILYAFTPYHYLRGEAHYFLSAYWLVPLCWLPAFALCRGEFPFFRLEPGGTWCFAPWRREGFRLLLLTAATASGGAYYAFFACIIYCFIGFYQGIVLRTVKPVVSAIVLSGLITFFGVVNHYPVFAHVMKNGKASVTERLAGEAEAYGMKFAQLVLPVDAHNLTWFGNVKARYDSWERPLMNENRCSALGIIASAGLLFLLVKLVFPRGREWPWGPLAAVNAFILLYATIGGFSSLFNLLVFEQIRCPNRISIFLMFLCLYAVLRPLDQFLAARSARIRWAILGGLLFVGIADQTPTPWFTERAAGGPHVYAKRFHADRRFFERIEETMPPGSKIFNCPYIPFPEVLPVHDMATYEHSRGYLHTNTLVWSYAMMKNREEDVWYESVSHDHRGPMIRRMILRGFDGIVVDKTGIETLAQANGLVNDIKMICEVGGKVRARSFESEDGMLAFIDLRGYRDWLQAQDPVRFEQDRKAEEEFVALCWIKGFDSANAYGTRNQQRWGYATNTISIVNPSDRTRVFRLGVHIGTDGEGAYVVRVKGPAVGLDDTVVLNRPEKWDQKTGHYGIRKEYDLVIPPGKHLVTVTCKPPWNYTPWESQSKMFYFLNIVFVEIK